MREDYWMAGSTAVSSGAATMPFHAGWRKRRPVYSRYSIAPMSRGLTHRILPIAGSIPLDMPRPREVKARKHSPDRFRGECPSYSFQANEVRYQHCGSATEGLYGSRPLIPVKRCIGWSTT